MNRSRAVPLGISLAALVTAAAFLRHLTGQTGAGDSPFLEAIGIAISTPAALVALTLLTGVFPFQQYYAERSAPALGADFGLSVLAATAVGLLGTVAVGQLIGAPVALFLVTAVLTFAGAVVTYFARTRSYLEWDVDDGEE